MIYHLTSHVILWYYIYAFYEIYLKKYILSNVFYEMYFSLYILPNSLSEIYFIKYIFIYTIL